MTVGCGSNAIAAVLLANNGDGTFSARNQFFDMSGSGVLLSLGVGDFNGDGKLDVALLNQLSTSVQASVLLLGENMNFGTPLVLQIPIPFSMFAHSSPSFVVADFNGDGLADVAVTDPVSNTLDVFLNTSPPFALTPLSATLTVNRGGK